LQVASASRGIRGNSFQDIGADEPQEFTVGVPDGI
jgi:hypothetical protein